MALPSRIHQKEVTVEGHKVIRLVDGSGQFLRDGSGRPIELSGGGGGGGGAPPTTSGGVTMDQLYDAVVALQGMIVDNKTSSDAFDNAANDEITAIKARLDALEAG